MTYKSPFLQELEARGFIYQGTDLQGLDALTAKESIALYIGYDATASSLHVGNLMTIMMLRVAQRHGHKPIVLMGGGTTKVADPSGKDKARPPLNEAQIQQNIQTIRGVFEERKDDHGSLRGYLKFRDCENAASMVDNDDWLANIKYMDFLSEYGAMFSINRMLTFDSVKLRLEREQPLSFLEFNYMVLQGYDFLELYKKNNCVLQMGGSDQWGNILNGVELIRKALNKQAYGLTCPLITTSSGAKMGKSAAGAVWLNADSLAPFDFWQYWRNVEDADVVRFLKLYTDLSIAEIDAQADTDINQLKILLANEVTRLAHGILSVDRINKNLEEIAKKEYPTIYFIDFDNYTNSIIETPCAIKYLDDYDQITLSEEDYDKEEIPDIGIPLFKILHDCNITESISDARKLIRQGSIKVNYKQITNEFTKINERWLKKHSTIFIQKGKKEAYIIKFRSFKNKDPEIFDFDLHHYNPETKEWTVEKDGLRKYLPS